MTAATEPPPRFVVGARSIALLAVILGPALAMWAAALLDRLQAAPIVLVVSALGGLVVTNRILGIVPALERASDQHWPTLGPATNELVLMVDAETLVVRLIGSAVEELLGYRKRQLLDRPVADLVSVHDRATVEALLHDPDGDPGAGRTDVRLRRADGVERWFELSVRRREEGSRRGLLVNLVDIDQRKANEIRIGEAVARQQIVLDHSLEVFVLTDDRLMIDHISPNVERITGHRAEALCGGPLAALLDQSSVEALVELLHRPEPEIDGSAIAVTVPSPTFGPLPAELVVRELPPNIHDGLLLILAKTAGTEQVGEVWGQTASRDELTGLLDRPSFERELGHALRRLPAGHMLGLVNLDIVDFEGVNDAVGFASSNRLLVAVANRLRSALRGVDVLGRLSSEQFTVAAVGPSSRALRRFAERLVSLFEEPFEVDGKRHRLEVRVGMATTDDRRGDEDQLMQAASVALHEAMQRTTDRVVVYDQAFQDQVVRRFEMTNALRPALDDGQFSVVYQPLISLRSGEVDSFEALLRWHHPEQGQISPATFIPLAEKSGIIVELGRWVMDQACSQLVDWRNRFDDYDQISMGINLSARQLERHGELDALLSVIERSGLDTASLIVELTESIVFDDSGWISSQLHHLRALGTRIAIDDFGTGAAGLSRLRELPHDIVKVDKSYIDRVGGEPVGQNLVAQIIELAKGLGATTVAEGIETEEQAGLLTSMGCDLGQGYHLARPMEAERIEEWMADRRSAVPNTGGSDDDRAGSPAN